MPFTKNNVEQDIEGLTLLRPRSEYLGVVHPQGTGRQ